MMRRTAFTLILALLTLMVGAKELVAKRGEIKGGYNFWFYNPDPEDVEEPKPLVLFLHGRSLSGNNLDRVKRYGTIDAITDGLDLDAYVIAPQSPKGGWQPEKLNDLIDWAWENYNIDSDRIYVLGMSMGGYGTIDMVNAYPDKIAAAMALCGGGSGNDFSNAAQVPLWIVHGTADKLVPVSASDKVVKSIRNAEEGVSRLVYQRVPGMNHGKPARFFYLPESYDWLFSHSLKDTDRPVNTDVFEPSALNKAYSRRK